MYQLLLTVYVSHQHIAILLLLTLLNAVVVMKCTGEAFEPDKDKTTNQLSAFFSVVVQKLLQTLTRDDWSDDNLRVQATEVYHHT
jgi:hypothetical protein